MRWLIGLLLCGICLSGCHQKPSYLLPQDTYINLLIELQLLKTYQLQQSPDSTKVDSLQKVIFNKYGTTKEQFKKNHRYYRRHVKQQTKRIQEAIKRMNKDRNDKPDSLAQKDSTQAK